MATSMPTANTSISIIADQSGLVCPDGDNTITCKTMEKNSIPMKPYDWMELHKRTHNDKEKFVLSTTKVFVDNILESTTKAWLRSHLTEQFGPLSSLRLMRRRRTSFSSRLTGGAVIEFALPQSATSCLAAEPHQLVLHGASCGRRAPDHAKLPRRRCNLLRMSPFYERLRLQPADMASAAEDEADEAAESRADEADAAAARRMEHAAQCALSLLNPMAFRAILERLSVKDWFTLLEVCSCSYQRVHLALAATRQFRIDGSLFRRGFPLSSPDLTDARCIRLLRQLPSTLSSLTISLTDYPRSCVTGSLLAEIARQFPSLETLELVPVRLNVADCRSAARVGLPRLARLRLVAPPPPRQFVCSGSAGTGRGGDECEIGEDAMWHLLKAVAPTLEELRIPAAALTGRCFYFLTSRLTTLELVGLVSPRPLRRLADSACCQSLRRLLISVAQPHSTAAGRFGVGGGHGAFAVKPWLDWQPAELFSRLSALCVADFAGRDVTSSAFHIELPSHGGFFGRLQTDIGPIRRSERWLAALGAFSSVSCLMLTNTSVDDTSLQVISRQLSGSLRVLCLTHCSRISPTGFVALADCRRLLRLRVSCTEFDLGVSDRLPPPGLEELAVASCPRLGQPLRLAYLQRLLSLRHLRSLDLSYCVGLPSLDEIADSLRRTDSVAIPASAAATTAAPAVTLFIECHGVSVPISHDQLESMHLSRPVVFCDQRSAFGPALQLPPAVPLNHRKWFDNDWALADGAVSSAALPPPPPLRLPGAWIDPAALNVSRLLAAADRGCEPNQFFDLFEDPDFDGDYDDDEFFDDEDDEEDDYEDHDDFSYDDASDDGY